MPKRWSRNKPVELGRPQPDMPDTVPETDAAIDRLGIDLLRELRAIAWFCDSGSDGKYPLVPSDRRHWYEPGGKMAALTETGCVRLLTPSYCKSVHQHRPALRVEQFGRRVLVRARALRLPIEIDDQEPDHDD